MLCRSTNTSVTIAEDASNESRSFLIRRKKSVRRAAAWSASYFRRQPSSSKVLVGMSPTTPNSPMPVRGMESARKQLLKRTRSRNHPRRPQSRRRKTQRARPTPKSRPLSLRLPQTGPSKRSSSARSTGSRSGWLRAKCNVALR